MNRLNFELYAIRLGYLLEDWHEVLKPTEIFSVGEILKSFYKQNFPKDIQMLKSKVFTRWRGRGGGVFEFPAILLNLEN